MSRYLTLEQVEERMKKQRSNVRNAMAYIHAFSHEAIVIFNESNFTREELSKRRLDLVRQLNRVKSAEHEMARYEYCLSLFKDPNVKKVKIGIHDSVSPVYKQ